MTFPATSPSILAGVAAPGLLELASTNPAGPVRHILVAPDVWSFVDEDSPEFVKFQFDLIKEKFLRNYLVTASLAGTSKSTVVFERLTDFDEVWVLCVRKPRDLQWRFFGRFAAPGVFVILLYKSRRECGKKKEYGHAAQEFLAEWLRVFGNNDCLRGNMLEDYFGEMVTNGDL